MFNELFPEIEISDEEFDKTPKSVVSLLKSLLEERQELLKHANTQSELIASLQKRIEELEARLLKNSSNSDKPPSSDNPYDKPGSKDSDEDEKWKKKKKGKPGAKPGHKGHKQKQLKPTEVHRIEPQVCPCGCSEFKNTEPFYTHQELELPRIEMIVRHFILMKGECAECGQVSKGDIPEGHHTGYGPRLSALIGEIGGINGNSRDTVKTFCSSVLRFDISYGGVQNVIDRVAAAIEPHYAKIADVSREAGVNYIDETSWQLSGKLNWLWVMANSLAVLFLIHTNRSKVAFQELVAGWVGILVSDGYAVYRKWVGQRQTCLAHLIRAAKGLEERRDKELARFGKWARKELQRLCHMAKEKPSRGEWLAFYARLSHLISRYRDCDNEAGVFARRLEREMENLFLFLKAEGVEPTNNFAERMLRFAVLWRKRSQGTRSEKGNRWVERILSLRQTCKLKGKPSYEVLVDAVECYFAGTDSDLTWIGENE
jgi:transposase